MECQVVHKFHKCEWDSLTYINLELASPAHQGFSLLFHSIGKRDRDMLLLGPRPLDHLPFRASKEWKG